MNTKILIEMLEKRSGHAITSAADCEWLALDFTTRCGKGISVNTLKRLLGFLAYDGKSFRQSTLDTIAAYLGFRDWNEAESAAKDKVSAFGHNPAILDADKLTKGDLVTVTYAPDRQIVFEYRNDDRFVVAKSLNSKLHIGDIVAIRQFVLGYPLLVTETLRDSRSLGAYTAAKIGGLTTIDCQHKEEL